MQSNRIYGILQMLMAKKCIIGNLYIGGCSISRHVDNVRNDAPAYEYRKIGTDGMWVQTDNKRLDEALREERWDIVYRTASQL